VMGAVRLSHGHAPGPAGCVACAGAAIGLTGLLAPSRLRWLYLALSYATYPIGFVLSYVILAVLFYGVIVPIGLAFRVCGYDPLRRRSSVQGSYWIARKPVPDPQRYLQQS
jgi:hypothetical protein